MNGAHRESMAEPRALEPGREETIAFDLHFTSWVFPAGHRIRLAVSNACWPMIWPSPTAMTLSLAVGEGGSSLVLPVIPHGGPSGSRLPAAGEGGGAAGRRMRRSA